MIARRLSIDPALLVSMFSRPDAWRAVANRLPEDAKVEQCDFANADKIDIWITSSVFREDDPTDLPAVEFEAVPIELIVKPISLSRNDRLRFEVAIQAEMVRVGGRKVEFYNGDEVKFSAISVPNVVFDIPNDLLGPLEP